MTDRIETLLGPLAMDGIGLEVAPYFNPAIDADKYNVRYTDYISSEEIMKKAAENPGAVGRKVPEIHFVWQPGKSLRECVNEKIEFDYALASHVIEHVPNTIGWLNHILETMRVGAKLALAVPDRRRTMDFYRRETTFGELVGNWINNPAIPTPTQVFDFLSQSFYDNRTAENGYKMLDVNNTPFEKIDRHYSDQQALEFAAFTVNQNHYLDVHCTVWTPEQFVEVFNRVVGIGLMNVRLSDPIVASDRDEFIIHMEKLGEPTTRRQDIILD